MRQAQVQVAGSGAGADDCQAHLPAAVVDLDARPQVAAVVAQGADESVHAVVVQGAAAVGGGHLRAGRQAGRGAGGQAGEGEEVQQDAERWPESTSAAACFVCPCACSDCRPSRPATLQQHSP